MSDVKGKGFRVRELPERTHKLLNVAVRRLAVGQALLKRAERGTEVLDA